MFIIRTDLESLRYVITVCPSICLSSHVFIGLKSSSQILTDPNEILGGVLLIYSNYENGVSLTYNVIRGVTEQIHM